MRNHDEISIRIRKDGGMHTFAKCRDCRRTIEAVCPNDNIAKKQTKATKILFKLFVPNESAKAKIVWP